MAVSGLCSSTMGGMTTWSSRLIEETLPTSLVLLAFSQEDQAILRRTFGNSTALFQKAIMGVFRQFKGMEPITNFFTNHGVETSFQSLLSEGRPTPDQLAKERGGGGNLGNTG